MPHDQRERIRMTIIYRIFFGVFLPFLISVSPIPELTKRATLDISRITNTAARYRGSACVSVYVEITAADSTVSDFGIAPRDCPTLGPVNRHGAIDFSRVNKRLESALLARANVAVDRAVAVAAKYGATLCVEFAIDFTDRRGRPGNFSVSHCRYN